MDKDGSLLANLRTDLPRDELSIVLNTLELFLGDLWDKSDMQSFCQNVSIHCDWYDRSPEDVSSCCIRHPHCHCWTLLTLATDGEYPS